MPLPSRARRVGPPPWQPRTAPARQGGRRSAPASTPQSRHSPPWPGPRSHGPAKGSPPLWPPGGSTLARRGPWFLREARGAPRARCLWPWAEHQALF
eukprot:9568771-Lingulodinium_polyedra.AAC.1